MICYRDRTFCASKKCQGCGRELTAEDKKNAKRLNLPISMTSICPREIENEQITRNSPNYDGVF